MRPFQGSYPQFPNQQVPNPNHSLVNSNSMCSNQRPPHSNTPHFSVQPNTSMSNGNGNSISAHNPHFANATSNQQVPMQNMQMGFPQPQFFPQNTMPQCHGHHHSNPQNLIMPQPNPQFFMNNRPQITNMPFGQFNLQNLPPHQNQINGFPHGQFPQQHLGFPQVNQFNIPPFMPHPFGCVNQGAQNVGFQMNPQSGIMNPQGQNMFVPSTMGQNALQVSSMNGQNTQGNSLNGGHTQFPQIQNGMQSGVVGQLQGNNAKDNGSNIPNTNQTNPNPQGNDSTRNPRFQKPGNHPMTNTKGNFRSFKGKGPNDKGPRNPLLAKCTKQETSIESPSPRTIPLNYSEDEIQKWRAERRKNHPSRPNSEKTQSEIIANDAQKRRQELKQILAKQAELGVEVAEIPKDYLLDDQSEQKEASNGNGKSKKRGGRRQKHDRSKNRFNKKQKTANNNDSSYPKPQMISKKKPSLLEKLLSGDIKRDKSHLLQAFRFMVLNNFFGEYPKKPLEFPLVKVKDMNAPPPQGEGNGDVSTIKKTEMVDDDENGEVVCEEVKHGEGGKEENSEVEEGELTD
ncbi:hypothetical protein ACHQM5_018628 [Ranunculus cassubicifolius]